MAEARQVVITGMGAVSAAGIGADKLWAAARDGISQIRELALPRPYKGRVKIAAQVRDFDARITSSRACARSAIPSRNTQSPRRTRPWIRPGCRATSRKGRERR